MSLEDLEKIASLESKLRQRLIIPITEVKPASFTSIVLLLPNGQAPPEPTVDVTSFLAKKHGCKVKLVCRPQQGANCKEAIETIKELLEGEVCGFESYIAEDDLATSVSDVTSGDKLDLIVTPLIKDSKEEFVKLIELLVQKLRFPILIVKESGLSSKKLLSNMLVLVREPNEIKAPLPVLTATCASKAKITFLTYIDESFLASIDVICDAISELSAVEKEKLVSSACGVIEKAVKEVEPALLSQGFTVNQLVEAGSLDVASVEIMKKTKASLIVIPVKVRMRPETKLVLMEVASSFLLIPEELPVEASEAPLSPPKKIEKEEQG